MSNNPMEHIDSLADENMLYCILFLMQYNRKVLYIDVETNLNVLPFLLRIRVIVVIVMYKGN